MLQLNLDRVKARLGLGKHGTLNFDPNFKHMYACTQKMIKFKILFTRSMIVEESSLIAAEHPQKTLLGQRENGQTKRNPLYW